MKNRHVGRQIMETAHRIKVNLDSVLDSHGINGLQARILGFVEKSDCENRDIYQKDIETEFKIRRSSVTSVLNTLEKNGFIQRCSVENDGRLKKIVLTAKAKKVGATHRATIDRFEQNLMDNMTLQ